MAAHQATFSLLYVYTIHKEGLLCAVFIYIGELLYAFLLAAKCSGKIYTIIKTLNNTTAVVQVTL
jgi:hypothetical protein